MILCGLKRDLVDGDDSLGAAALVEPLFCKKYVEVSAIN
jgi:hypothetical protein